MADIMYCIASQVVDGAVNENHKLKLAHFAYSINKEMTAVLPLYPTVYKDSSNYLPLVGLKQEELSMGMTVFGTIGSFKSSETLVI